LGFKDYGKGQDKGRRVKTKTRHEKKKEKKTKEGKTQSQNPNPKVKAHLSDSGFFADLRGWVRLRPEIRSGQTLW
jgi:hypothetical protein